MFHQDTLQFKRGGGKLLLLGLPFLAFGIIFTIVALSGSLKSPHGAEQAKLIGTIVGLVCTLIGLSLTFGRIGLILDKRQRIAIQWWGLAVPFKRTLFQIPEEAWITLCREVRKGDKSTRIVYPVRITADGKDLALIEPEDYEQARTAAEQAAKFMGLGLKDDSSGELVVREPGTLDQSLRERLSGQDQPLEMPARPDPCSVTESVVGDEAVFELPKPKNGSALLILILVTASLFGLPLMGMGVVAAKGAHPTAKLIIMGILCTFGLLPIILAGLPMLRRRSLREKITVSTRGLRLEQKWALGVRTSEIPADELEELTITQRPGRLLFINPEPIVARSDRLNLEFGTGLSKEEREWIRDVIRYLVTAPKSD